MVHAGQVGHVDEDHRHLEHERLLLVSREVADVLAEHAFQPVLPPVVAVEPVRRGHVQVDFLPVVRGRAPRGCPVVWMPVPAYSRVSP